MVYCIPNAPHQHGSLWVKVVRKKVHVMAPAGKWWRDKIFTIDEFNDILRSGK